jgi:hypothetical protein
MANYGPSGGGPQPWHEPRPGEWHDHGWPPGTQPPDAPGHPHDHGHGYGGHAYGDGSSHGGGQPYGSGSPYGGGHPYGGSPYGGGHGYGGGPAYGSGQGHDASGHDASGHGYGQGYDSGTRYGSGQPYGAGADHGGTPYGNPAAMHGAPPPGGPAQPAPPGPTPHGDATTAYAGTPVPPPGRRGGRGRLLAVLAAVLVLVLGGVTVSYLFGRDEEAPTPVAAPTEQVAPTTDAPVGEETPPDDPVSTSAADPRFVRAGQCVRNDAPAGAKPRLLISDCVPESYEVLRRFDGKTSGERDAEAKCAQVDGYTNWYFYDSELDSLDFVLCLKQRS